MLLQIIDRKKKFNKDYKRADTKYQFKYSLTDSGLNLVKKKLKKKEKEP